MSLYQLQAAALIRQVTDSKPVHYKAGAQIEIDQRETPGIAFAPLDEPARAAKARWIRDNLKLKGRDDVSLLYRVARSLTSADREFRHPHDAKQIIDEFLNDNPEGKRT